MITRVICNEHIDKLSHNEVDDESHLFIYRVYTFTIQIPFNFP